MARIEQEGSNHYPLVKKQLPVEGKKKKKQTFGNQG
jgi:hypothetical protein